MRLFWWMRRNRELNGMAAVVSRVFSPLVVLPVTLVVASWSAYISGQRWMFLVLLVWLDALLPAAVLYWFVKKGEVRSGFDITKREERVPLFLFVVLAHFVGVALAWFLNRHPTAEYLSMFFVLVLIFTILTLRWKVSVHTGVISSLVTFVVLVFGRDLVWLYGLVFLVAWARVQGQFHRSSQVLAAGVIPIVVLPVMFFVFGFL